MPKAKELDVTFEHFYAKASGTTIFSIRLSNFGGNLIIFEGSKNELEEHLEELPGLLQSKVLAFDLSATFIQIEQTKSREPISQFVVIIDYQLTFIKEVTK
jgi:hypothetical protein